MTTIVKTLIEKKRLNGHRIPGELYLVGKLPSFQCCNIPAPLPADTVPKRSLVPIPEQFLHSRLKACKANKCPGVDHSNLAGMMWINEKHYPSAAHFFQECRTMPVQLRIKRLHCGITPGKSWVLLAHRKAIVDYEGGGCNGWVDSEGNAHSDVVYKPGIFAMFLVDSVEYVIHGKTELSGIMLQSDAEMNKPGITLVNVLHDEELAELPDED